MPHESLVSEMKRSGNRPPKSQAELRATLEKKLLATKPHIDSNIAEYEQALTDRTFEDREGEEDGSGEKRQEAMQKKLLALVKRAKQMKARLDSKEPIADTPEADTTTLEPFLADTFQKWYSSDKTFTQPEQTPSLAIPSDLDLPSLKADTDPAKFGEYTLNPECIGINYETVAITTKDITRDKGYLALPNKDLATVAKYIIDTYSTKYILPDLSFYQWVIENPTKAPQELKDGNWHFTFGSVLRDRVGVVRVPIVFWDGSGFARRAFGLDRDWRGDYRVVLLER